MRVFRYSFGQLTRNQILIIIITTREVNSILESFLGKGPARAQFNRFCKIKSQLKSEEEEKLRLRAICYVNESVLEFIWEKVDLCRIVIGFTESILRGCVCVYPYVCAKSEVLKKE